MRGGEEKVPGEVVGRRKRWHTVHRVNLRSTLLLRSTQCTVHRTPESLAWATALQCTAAFWGG